MNGHKTSNPPGTTEIDALAQLAGRAMSRSGVEKVMFAGSPHAVAQSAAIYRLLMVEAPQCIHTADGQAVMLALPPDAEPRMLSWSWLTAGLTFLSTIGLRQTVWFARFDRFAQHMRQRLVKGPHVYVRLLAVDPASQGRGVGGTLLNEAITMAEGKKVPVYLETHEAENVRFYRRFGFEVKEEKQLDIGVTHYGMVRPFRTI